MELDDIIWPGVLPVERTASTWRALSYGTIGFSLYDVAGRQAISGSLAIVSAAASECAKTSASFGLSYREAYQLVAKGTPRSHAAVRASKQRGGAAARAYA